MGASPMMSLGLRAMSASYAAMQATSHNIANASVDGYSRQQAELTTAKGQYTGAGFFGRGVDVKTVSRAHDDFLSQAVTAAKSLSTMDAARLERLRQVEQVFPPGEGGIGYTISSFLNAMVDLASRPGDTATRQVVLARADDLATRFNSAGKQFDTIQAGVTQDLKATVATVNGLSESIARVNSQIAAVQGLGQAPNDLLDERDRLIDQLAEHVQVTTVQADNGMTAVFIAGGQSLVLGNVASKMQVVPDAQDPSRSALALVEGTSRRVIDGNSLGGGSIAGLLKFQNTDLVDARNLIGQLATSIAGAVNAQQMIGVNLQVPAGSVPSQPLFALGAAQALPGAGNQRDAATGGYLASVTLKITDPTAVKAADYELRADPGGAAGVYQLTRKSAPPLVMSVSSGDIVDGMRIDIGSPEPAATDRFLLQPVGRAALGMTRLLQDPRDLAAASPLVATTATSNVGSVSVASLTMLTPPPEPGANAHITFTSDNGDYSWDLRDSSNAVISSGTGTWTVGDVLPAPPNDINGFALQLSGVPRSGDVIDVQPTPSASLSANNGNALALSALRDALLVGQTLQPDGSLGGGATATDAYASALADIGVRVQSADASATISASVAQQAEQAASAASGVNLDEEAARLIQYQQSYQAAAKVLQVAQSIFDTLLQVAGR